MPAQFRNTPAAGPVPTSRAVRAAMTVALPLVALACARGQIDLTEDSALGPAAGGPAKPGTAAVKPGSGPGAGPGAGAGGTGSTGPAPNPAVALGPGEILPTRIRRLANAEFDASVAALFGTSATPGKGFANDTRQSDFTLNAGQRVDPVYAAQVQTAARDLAKDAAAKTLAGLGCSSGDACADRFVADFAARAFRRPLGDDEKKDLLAVYQAGAMAATFTDGVELVVTAVLQSASFLYVTELGGAPPKNGLVTLTGHETATTLAYLFTGGPPDKPLLDAAAGKLGTGAERDAQARRLLMLPGAKTQLQRLIKEWIGIDHLLDTGKDKTVYPKFEELRPVMAQESDAFINEVMFGDDGTIGKLFTADYTVVDTKLGSFYGLPNVAAGKRTMLGGSGRRGLLTQASFLSVHGHDNESAPVKRGSVVLKKILCSPLPTPSELNLEVIPPKPDPKQTTRERFAVHAKDPACFACHAQIDPIGFSFEGFDGMGGQRTMENGRPVNTATELAAGSLTGSIKDAAEMVTRLVDNEDVRLCFARNLFRFAAAQSGAGFEDKFVKDVWEKLPAARRTSVKDVLIAYAASDLFVTRRVPQ